MPKDDDFVPLDTRTLRWLTKLSKVTGDSPAVLVAKILRDIRIDDERAHATTH